MPPNAPDDLNLPVTPGVIADNIIGFARALRAAGMPVGPGATIDALKALQVVGLNNRSDVFTALESVFVKRHEHAAIFAQAFEIFFRAVQDWDQLVDSRAAAGPARAEAAAARLAAGAGGARTARHGAASAKATRRRCSCPSRTRRCCRRRISRR